MFAGSSVFAAGITELVKNQLITKDFGVVLVFSKKFILYV